MILIDTSAWVEFLRDTGSPVCSRVDAVLADDHAICDPVRMEVLAGARDDEHLRNLRRLLARATSLATESTDYEDAAGLYRACRRNGSPRTHGRDRPARPGSQGARRLVGGYQLRPQRPCGVGRHDLAGTAGEFEHPAGSR